MTNLLLRIFLGKEKDTSSPSYRAGCGKLSGIVGIICNLILFAGKLIAGTIAGSVSITADAVNNLSDASSSLVTLLGFKLAERPADDDHPYGHARIEYLSGLAVAALILIIGGDLAKSSFMKIIHPEDIDFSVLTVVILVCSIALKLWMSFFCRKLGKLINSPTLMATSADSRNDVISTAAVLLGCIIGYFFHIRIDGYVGLLVALFILYSGFGIAKETISPLLGESADPEVVKAVSDLLLSKEKILGIHDLMVHDYGPGQCYASVHAELDYNEDVMIGHELLDDLEKECWEQLHIHLVIHYDPIITEDSELTYMKEKVKDAVHSISAELSIHDFRMVRGQEHTNLIFDLVIPFSLRGHEKELKAKIDAAVQQEDHKYYTVIQFDDLVHNK